MATVNGTSANDTLSGTAGDDTINGLGGNDLFLAGSTGGNDLIDGGTGFDTIEFRERATSAVVVDFRTGSISGGSSGTITFTNVERVVAGNFDDSLTGNAASQTLTGRFGADTLWGAGGVDTLWGGGDGNTFVFRETGTANADLINDFASGSDKILLDASVMSALGASGSFAAGDDRFVLNSAQDAEDRIIYNTTTRQIFYDADGSGSGAAVLIATLQSGATLAATDIVVEGGGGQGIFLQGGDGNDTLVGGPGDDTIKGGANWDTLEGGPGNDLLDGESGPDVLRGGDGNDTLLGGAGGGFNDFLYGGAGDDWLDGGRGDEGDVLYGEDGNDVLVGGDRDTLDGGAGVDTMYGSDTGWLVQFFVTAGDVIVDRGGVEEVHSDISWTLGSGIEHLFLIGTAPIDGRGNGLNNFIAGNAAANYIFLGAGADRTGAGDGNDTIEMEAGASGEDDWIDGGSGTDTLNLAGYMESGVVMDLTREGGTLVGGGVGGTGSATLFGIENVIADRFADRLTGSDVDNVIDGGAGDDTLDGNGGNDTLIGGAGADRFLFTDAPGAPHADRIVDFVSGTDRIGLDMSVPDGSLGPSGSFAAGDERFFAGPGATSGRDASDRVVYNTSTGDLYYDPDGSGSADAQLIVTLQSGATLVATDIVVETVIPPAATFTGTEGDDTLVGTDGSDRIEGLGGNDSLVGHAGRDRLLGGTGNDTLSGSIGIDTLEGGLGNDTYLVASSREDDDVHDIFVDSGGIDTVISTGSWTLAPDIENLTFEVSTDERSPSGVGNNLANRIISNTPDWGSASVDGADGNDTLIGGDGREHYFFEAGSGNYGNDSLDGGDEIDWIHFGGYATSGVVIDLKAGTLSGGRTAGSATFVNIENAEGGGFNDLLIAHDGHLVDLFEEGLMTVGAVLFGRDGDDTLVGGASRDSLGGDLGSDRLDGGAGNDRLHGGQAADSFIFSQTPGEANADVIEDFASGVDTIGLDATVMPALGASGRFSADDGRLAANSTGTAQDTSDRVVYNTSTGELWYDADGSGSGAAQRIATLDTGFGPSSLAATDIEVFNGSTQPPDGGEVINGTSGNDTLTGTAGNDTINGLGGNDLFIAGSTGGNDVIDGGAGHDTIEFRERATSAVVVDFGTGSISGGSSGTISFTNVERIVGGDFNDSMTGNAASQTLTGKGGNDTLWGAGGVDTLWGLTGADTFIFRETGTANADRISDWASGVDTLALDNAAMGALGAEGDFVAGDTRFASGAGFTAGRDTSDRVVFDTSTGRLYYDADGSGSGAAQLIATVQSGVSVAATDIVVI